MRPNFNCVSLALQAQEQAASWEVKCISPLSEKHKNAQTLRSFQQDRHLTSSIPSLKPLGRLVVSHCKESCILGRYIAQQ